MFQGSREHAPAAGRIALFALIVLGLSALYTAYFGVASWFFPTMRSVRQPVAFIVGAIAVLALALIALVARSRRRLTPAVLVLLDAATVVVPGVLLTVSAYFMADHPATAYRTFIAATFLVFSRALFVPSSAVMTALLSTAVLGQLVAVQVLVAVTVPAATLLPPAVHAVSFTVWSIVGVIIASLGSGVIYGLRRQVHEAEVQVREARQLGQYTLREKIGQGGMGVVYRARHALLRRPTAIKLMSDEACDELHLKRFEREVQLTSELTHPNTVAVYDYGRSPDGVFYYAMEHLDGVDLDTLVSDFGAQPLGRTVHILVQVCGALAEAHERSLVHRDIKPANILLCHRGGMPDVVKVLDFGLVKEMHRDEASLSNHDLVAGTPAFLSPEAIMDPEAVGPQSDLYALGAVAYYLLTGAYVFTGNIVDVCGAHLHARPIPPHLRCGRAVDAELESIVLSCLEKEPRERPAGARELGRRLRQLQYADWSEDDAQRWWDERGAVMLTERARRHEVERSGPATIVVDLRDRQRESTRRQVGGDSDEIGTAVPILGARGR
jgi:serine/threonine-protein kinase